MKNGEGKDSGCKWPADPLPNSMPVICRAITRMPTSHRRWCIALGLASLLLAACNNTATSAATGSPTDSPDDAVRQLLPGTWLRDYTENGIRARRILVLEPEGKFRELVRIVDAGGMVTEHLHLGDWLYDGTNLKRKYTSMDGKQPSAPTLPFAAFQLRFESKNEFIGTDNVRKREVRYQRVAPETLP